MSSSDSTVQGVAWRDLVKLSPRQKVHELMICLPWLAGSWLAYDRGWIVVGGVCSFFFFLTGLRLSHNAQHRALGIGRLGHDLVLFVLSFLMFSSMHAVRVTHLHHHRHCLGEQDFEARHVHHPWWRVLLCGWLFPFQLHAAAWRLGKPRDRKWIAFECVAMAVWAGSVLWLLEVPALRWHLLAVVTGECFTAFFAVWTVHRGCHRDGPVARTQRGRLKNLLSYAMFFHLEHHLFPAVPTCRLKELARRIDRRNPSASRLQVF